MLALLALSEVERQKKTPELHRFVVEVSSVRESCHADKRQSDRPARSSWEKNDEQIQSRLCAA